ncbi:uncharacterized protein LOC123717901 isoform X3 [Pieris brassicae]|uniref:uncharacterized protein LOC123717901 isoform X3 n=1 Tax=Pieris brassicae TaxID=7116 RepID=UPI001E66102E|nr:uncharacterized protein LOC123717901 isoform X3 [Pieris brassicae]
MSSSSSDEHSECFDYNNITPWPMQPLVYYTNVPYREKPKSGEKKRNPNCFVKAFRWYTQERCPKKTDSMSTNAPEIKGFAMWLDQKYHEFIHDGGGRSKYTLKKTSTLEFETKSNKFPCDSCGAKKFKRPKRSNKSFEILLHPKHTVSRTASESCQRGYSCCSLTQKAKRKSQSLTSVLLEREVYQIPYDEVDDRDEVKKILATIVDPTHGKELQNTAKSSKARRGDSKKNISCQCINESVTFDASCQCPTIRAKVTSQSKLAIFEKADPEKLKNDGQSEVGNASPKPIQPFKSGNVSAFTLGTQTCDNPIQLARKWSAVPTLGPMRIAFIHRIQYVNAFIIYSLAFR